MKKNTLHIIYGFVIIILAIFATLYIVKPRVVYEKEIIKVVEKMIPEHTEINFPPTKPDTTFAIEMRGKNLIASQKTFKEALGGKPEAPFALITSVVIAYATVPVDYLANNLIIDLNRELIIEDIKNSLPPDKRPYKYALYGILAGIIIDEIFNFIKNLIKE